jgi:hypothetical protein
MTEDSGEGMHGEALRARFGQRVQRCQSCFIGFYVKEMFLGPGGAFYCTSCKDETMFPFDEFSRRLDLSRVPGLAGEPEI